ncbi:MAG: hypothetical protein Q9226_001930 [Calogaya cf. arnoldii]
MARCSGSSLRGDYDSNAGWTSQYGRATLAFEIIMALALLSTLIFSSTNRKRISAAKQLYICFLVAISLMIFTSTFHITDTILNEECLRVQNVYLIFEIIFLLLKYLADALLLAAIFIYLIPRSILTRQFTQSSPSKGPTYLHLLPCALLGLFWLVLTILYLILINTVISTSGLVSGVRKLDFTYNLIYFLASLEIIVLAVMRLTSSRSKAGRESVQTSENKKSPLFFLLFISLPLLIRSIWGLAISARFNLSSDFFALENPALRLVQQLFYYLCTTLIYLGLALIVKNLSSEPTFTNMGQSSEEEGKAGLGPEIPVMRVAAPVEDLRPFDPHASPRENSRGSRLSRDHSQDPIYNGP